VVHGEKDSQPMADVEPIRLVLASASRTRARLLTDAGLSFVCRPADVDEASIKNTCRTRGVSAEDAALTLAEAKAITVSEQLPQSLVIGADQLMVCGDLWFDKPLSKQGARQTLLSLRGQSHRLISGLAVARAGTIVWTHLEVADLTMRNYSDSFIDWYVEQADEADLQSVGACRLEGLGVQAFSRINGDYFTILGLPLLPLLDFLRQQDMLPV
jgi:septum formation protein